MTAMREGFAAGKSLREVAAEVGVSPATLSEWRKKDVAGSPEAVPAEPDPALVPDAAAIEAIIAEPLPTRDDPEALVKARRREAMIHDLLVDLTPAVKAEEFPVTSFVQAAKYADDLVMRIAELTPPAPRDPNDDPDVIEAERVLLSRIEKQVAEAEERGRRA